MLVFLAADKTRLQDLDEATRRYLAWESVVDEKLELNLDPRQVKQAEAQKDAADRAVTARLPETYQWLLVPVQSSPQRTVEWQAVRLSGQEGLAVRASKKLRSEELLIPVFAPSMLRKQMDEVPLWRGNHVPIGQLIKDFARYLYLPRVKDPAVLMSSMREGIGLLTWEQDSFAYADSYDESAGRYRGLRYTQQLSAERISEQGLLVRPDVALRQIETETRDQPGRGDRQSEITDQDEKKDFPPIKPETELRPKRFHGSVDLDPERVGRDASRIAEEVIAHLLGLVRSRIRVTLEIEAESPTACRRTLFEL